MSTEITIRQFRRTDSEAVVTLWKRCDLVRPWNDPDKDIERKLSDSPDLFLVMEQLQDPGTTQDANKSAPRLVGSAMAGYDGHRGWVNYLAIDPDCQKLGLGRQMMDFIEQHLEKRGCPKINLQVRDTNTDVLAFYKSLGYQVDAAVSLGKRLIPDD